MSESNEDRVAQLEQQMHELQRMLMEERERRKEEREASENKVRLLEARLEEVDNVKKKPKLSSKVPRVANLPKKTQAVYRDVAVTTPRTSDNLFAAMPSKSERPPRQSYTRKATDTKAAAASREGSPSNEKQTTSAPVDVGPSTETNDPQHTKETALQHSWDKFCYIARNQFTPQELSLVSADTLRNLLEHYRVRSPVERAQVEAQWALLQEGKETVGGAATPRSLPSNKRVPIRQAQHPAEFNVDIQRAKPHLSRRVALNAEAQRPSNPNDTTSRSGHVRTSSATRIIMPRDVGASNPNDSNSPSTPRRYCFARAEATTPRSQTPRGMRHVQGPTSGEHTPRGIRSEGSTHHGPDRSKQTGIKTSINNGTTEDGNSSRRGLRTFNQPGSPVREHRPTRVVSTPPHLMRQRLGTETLHGSSLSTQRSRANQQSPRAPFATD